MYMISQIKMLRTISHIVDYHQTDSEREIDEISQFTDDSAYVIDYPPGTAIPIKRGPILKPKNAIKPNVMKEIESLKYFKEHYHDENTFELYDFYLHDAYIENECMIASHGNATYIPILILKIPNTQCRYRQPITIPPILYRFQHTAATIYFFWHYQQVKQFMKDEEKNQKYRLPYVIFYEWRKIRMLYLRLTKKTKKEPTENHTLLWLILLHRMSKFHEWKTWHTSLNIRYQNKELSEYFDERYIRKALWYTHV